MARGRPVLSDDYAALPDAVPHPAYEGFRSAIVAPMRWSGEVMGILGVGTRDPERRFSQADAGLLEAFANIYSSAIRVIHAKRAGETPDPLDLDFPTVQDGAVGVHFILTALRSGQESKWVDASYTPPSSS